MFYRSFMMPYSNILSANYTGTIPNLIEEAYKATIYLRCVASLLANELAMTSGHVQGIFNDLSFFVQLFRMVLRDEPKQAHPILRSFYNGAVLNNLMKDNQFVHHTWAFISVFATYWHLTESWAEWLSRWLKNTLSCVLCIWVRAFHIHS